MNYQNYIELGFKRLDINDSVEFKETGYEGYVLLYELGRDNTIEVHFRELDKPKLYMPKNEKQENHIIILTTEQVLELTKNTHNVNKTNG